MAVKDVESQTLAVSSEGQVVTGDIEVVVGRWAGACRQRDLCGNDGGDAVDDSELADHDDVVIDREECAELSGGDDAEDLTASSAGGSVAQEKLQECGMSRIDAVDDADRRD